MRFRPLLIALAPVLLVATGCGPKPINESKTLNLDLQTPANAVLVPAQKKAVKLTVTFAATAGEVLVFVFKESDIPNDEAMTMADPAKALASGKGKDGTFTADVPENTATRVVVRSSSVPKTDVKVTVSTGK